MIDRGSAMLAMVMMSTFTLIVGLCIGVVIGGVLL